MTVLPRCRIEKELLNEADQVSAQMGASTGEVVRMCLTALARQRRLPFAASAEEPDADILPPRVVRAKRIEAFYGDKPACEG